MSLFPTRWRGDAVVLGAGPAGSATARVLAAGGMQVTLIGDHRRHAWAGETLPAGSTQMLTSVFGDGVLDGQMRAYATRAAWETTELQETDALANPLGEGWLLDRRRFDEQARAAAARAGAFVLEGHAQWSRTPSRDWHLRVGESECVARMLVDATGRSAFVARRVGATAVETSRMLACIRHVADVGDPAQATMIEAVDAGWWYSTPVPSGGRVLALITDGDLVPRGPRLAAWWHECLTRTHHIRELLPDVTDADLGDVPPVLSPAGTGWLDRLHGDGWAAAGDAAAHFDPLSSQGILTGILMGSRLAHALLNDGLEAWERDYRMLIDEHVTLSTHYYGLVDRWPQSTFWQRRTSEAGS